MPRTGHLYLRTGTGITGPIPARQLHEMVKQGSISRQTPVSSDGIRWLIAGRISGLFEPRDAEKVASKPVQIPIPAVRPELRDIIDRLDRSVGRLALSFHPFVALAVLAVLFASFCLLITTGRAVFPDAPLFMLSITAILPAILSSAAAGHFAGNFLIRTVTNMSCGERRCLSLHLPWSKAPDNWPGYLCGWVYDGDWLVEKEYDALLPYVRAFITGKAPATIEEELHIWDELMSSAVCADIHAPEVGHAVRELACLKRLPEWVHELEPGTSYSDLETRLGACAHDWAICLLRRAGTRIPELEALSPEDMLENVCFEFNYSLLSENREALLVMIRPNRSNAVFTDSIVRETPAA